MRRPPATSRALFKDAALVNDATYFDYLERGICLVEWFENIPECLPDEYFEVIIDKINDGEARRISVYLR